MTQKRQMQIDIIANNNALSERCAQLREASAVAIDTEFMREHTYYPEFCLLQIADDKQALIVDPLAITDWSGFIDLLNDASVTKVFHSGRQDLEIFLQQFDTLPDPLFDTQIAASLLGLGEQVGYAKLVETLLKQRVNKSQTRTDWSRRPLSDAQIEYAALDVVYLIQIYPMMRKRLLEQNRLDWLRSDFDELTRPETYQLQPEDMWRKVKGLNKLRGQELAIVQALAAWREQTAITRNLPRKRVLSDNVIVDLARQRPADQPGLAQIRSLHAKQVQRDGQAILDRLLDAQSLPREQWPSLPERRALSANQEALADTLMALIKLQADHHQLSPGLLASRKEVEALIRGKRDLPLCHGWRYEHGGEQVMRFLQGESRLRIQQGKLTLDHPD